MSEGGEMKRCWEMHSREFQKQQEVSGYKGGGRGQQWQQWDQGVRKAQLKVDFSKNSARNE